MSQRAARVSESAWHDVMAQCLARVPRSHPHWRRMWPRALARAWVPGERVSCPLQGDVTLRYPTVTYVNGHRQGAEPPCEALRDGAFEPVPHDPVSMPFEALNAQLATDGLAVTAGGTLQGLGLNAWAGEIQREVAAHERHRLRVPAGCELVLWEQHRSVPDSQAYWRTSQWLIHLEPGARLVHLRMQREHQRAHHAGCVWVRQEAGSHYIHRMLHVGGGWSALHHVVVQQGPQAVTDIQGVCGVWGQHDLITHVHHLASSGHSRQLIHGVVCKQGILQHESDVQVQACAVDVEASAYSHHRLLDPASQVHTSPRLHIWPDAVSCRHGATVGQWDPDAVLYLMSRGLSEVWARRLLLQAFLSTIMDALPEPEARAWCEEHVVSLA